MTLFPLLWRTYSLLVLVAQHVVPADNAELREIVAWDKKRRERRAVEERRPEVLGYEGKCSRCHRKGFRLFAMPPDGRAMCITCRKETKSERGWI